MPGSSSNKNPTPTRVKKNYQYLYEWLLIINMILCLSHSFILIIYIIEYPKEFTFQFKWLEIYQSDIEVQMMVGRI